MLLYRLALFKRDGSVLVPYLIQIYVEGSCNLCLPPYSN